LVITDITLLSITHTLNPASCNCLLDQHFKIKYATIKNNNNCTTITVLNISELHEAQLTIQCMRNMLPRSDLRL